VYDEDSVHNDVFGESAAGSGAGNAGGEGPRVRHKNELVLCICVDRLHVHLRKSAQGGGEQQEKLLHLMIEGGAFMHRSAPNPNFQALNQSEGSCYCTVGLTEGHVCQLQTPNHDRCDGGPCMHSSKP
jgi:hypothetical protein